MLKKGCLCLWLLSVLLCSFFCQSCKKGCTDPKAYNYDHGAKQNDGSCLYCDSVVQNTPASSNEVLDQNSSSPHFEQDVLFITISANTQTYNGNGCQRLGLINNPNTGGGGCINVTYIAALTNETSNTMILSGTMEMDGAGTNGSTILYNFSNVTIGPNATVSVNVGTACSLGNTNFFVGVNNAVFTYH